MAGGLNPSFVRLRAIFSLTLVVFIASAFFWDNSGPESTEISSTNSAKDFYWIDVEPTHDLIWHKCYQPLQRECARLLVPLDHLNNSDGRHAAIALIRKPSHYAESSLTRQNDTSTPDPRYRGPILFNPGGPGGSGVDLVNRLGDLLAQVLNDEFDIVSFDPRGVARSTPKILFFDDALGGKGEREVWGGSTRDILRGGVRDENGDVDGEKGNTVERAWARSVVTNQLAGERGGEWLGNINTEQTAHDMLSIVKAHGREKLMYWGFSYGTVLGATFAALFPDKFDRMVLDGVEDAENYYATLWNNNLLDTPSTLNHFFEMCHTAGPSSCAFWAPSPSLIAANLTRIYRDLIKEPIPVRTPISYGILDYSRVRALVFSSLYKPWATWKDLAEALADLGGPDRDPGRMWTLTELPTFKCSSCSSSSFNDDKEQRERDFETSVPESSAGISCSDGVDAFPDLASAKKFFEDFSRESEWADYWATIPLSCSGWPKVRKGFQGPIKGNTISPILFVGNTADPVTPLAHAKTTSKRFPGSRVLTQDSPGHCSMSGPSVCTQNFIREYFVSGTLPPEGTVCPVISSPFSDPGLRDLEKANEAVFTSAQEKSMRDAVEELSRAWGSFRPGLL